MPVACRSRAGSVVLVVAAALFPTAAPAQPEVPPSRPVKTVGVIWDGDDPYVSLRLPPVFDMIVEHATDLTRRDLDLRFPDNKRIMGRWDLDGIEDAIDRQFSDPEVDIVLTLGPLATNLICRRPVLPKPVIAAYAVDPQAQGLRYTTDDPENTVSGVRNLNYLTNPEGVMRDLRKFHEITRASRIHVMTDSLLADSIPEIPEFTIAASRTVGIEVVLVPVSVSAEAALALVPDDAEAVYVTPLPRFSPEEFDRLVAGLIARRLPSFSLSGRPEVELGIMAGQREPAGSERLARRIALNIQRTLLGEDPGTLSIVIDPKVAKFRSQYFDKLKKSAAGD